MSILKNADQRSAMAAKKDERTRDAALAMREYEAEKLAVHANTARLRALRLAKEAEQVTPERKPGRNTSPKGATYGRRHRRAESQSAASRRPA